MNHKYRYGQQEHNFDEGIVFFMAPHQVLQIEVNDNSREPSGWMLMVHPDFGLASQMVSLRCII